MSAGNPYYDDDAYEAYLAERSDRRMEFAEPSVRQRRHETDLGHHAPWCWCYDLPDDDAAEAEAEEDEA